MMEKNLPRSEYPNPQWERKNWLCLNGSWEFDFDFGKSALDRRMYDGKKLEKSITVPFCPESVLSGIGYTDFMPAVIYRKSVTLSAEQLGGRVILHFGAVDYYCAVYVNSVEVCRHSGGYTPFEADITEYVHEGENSIFVYAEDDVRSGKQCGGKQCTSYASHGCSYTRCTGIWQSVWLEFVPEQHILSAKYYTDIENGTLTVTGRTNGSGRVTVTAFYDGEEVGTAQAHSSGAFALTVKLSSVELWEPGCGRLYDLTLKFGEDTVYSYFGMRSVGLEGMKFFINGKTVFQRLVLDQGYYPDGIYTAPSEEALVRDIELSIGLGFNGARLHQKLFEPRFLYHCDRLGYMVWDEYGNWDLDHACEEALTAYANEWTEAMERDFNHPSVIGWCPFNETWDYVEKEHKNKLLSTIYKLTKAMDITRPCIDTSGNYHVITDIYDVHDYEQDPVKFTEYYKDAGNGTVNDQTVRAQHWRGKQQYGGEPIFISEYGGIKWDINGGEGWGYGEAPKTAEEFIERYRGLTNVLLDNPYIMGFCYTQLYDVEQEQNGLYTYERKPKFDDKIFRDINRRTAAIEKDI